MLRGVQRANQVEVQVQPVDVLLRNRGGVQQDVRLPDAVHVRRHVNAADSACVGHVGVVVGADFFGQVIHRDRLKLRHEFGRIIHAAAGQRSGVRHKLVDFLGGHGGLGFRQLRRQIGFNCFLLPRRGNGRHGDDALIVLRQVLLGNFGVLAFRLVLLEVVHVRDCLFVGVHIAGGRPAVGDVLRHVHAKVAFFGHQRGFHRQRGSDCVQYVL